MLETDLAQWGRAAMAGNLPYYIASPILEKVLPLNPPRAVFLIQKEVAERLAARPGDREYGYLTVRTALFAEAQPGLTRPRRLSALPGPVFPPEAQDAPQQPGRHLRQGSGRCLARSLPPRPTDFDRGSR